MTTQKSLLAQLTTDLQAIILQAEKLYDLNDTQFNQKPSPERWSVAECLVHLNYYKNVYLPPLTEAIQRGKSPKQDAYEGGWLGNYFTNMMMPKDGFVKNTMRAPKPSQPTPSQPTQSVYTKAVLDEFLAHQRTLLGLLRGAEQVDLIRTKAPIPTVGAWLKLRIGDVFRFLIAHEQRHFIQIKNVMP
jgi:hypothetical protein